MVTHLFILTKPKIVSPDFQHRLLILGVVLSKGSLFPALHISPLCFKSGSGNLKWYFLDISPSRRSRDNKLSIQSITKISPLGDWRRGWEVLLISCTWLLVVARAAVAPTVLANTNTHTHQEGAGHRQHFCNLHAAPSSLLSISKSHKLNLVFD